MSRYILVLVEDGTELSINLPKGLVCNVLYDDLESKVKDVDRLQWLVKQLALNVITEDNDGVMLIKDKRIPSVNLREALVDTCNDKFLEKHEQFYTILRQFDVVF